MIEIIINGSRIALPVGLVLTREAETAIFNREKTVYDITWPIDIPLTDENIVALGYPNSLANPNIRQEYSADLIISNMYVDRVTVKMLKVSLKAKTCSISLIGVWGSLARLIGDSKLADLHLGGRRTIGTTSATLTHTYNMNVLGSVINVDYFQTDTQNHMKAVALGTTITDYVFAPAFDSNMNLENMHDEAEESIINGWWIDFSQPANTGRFLDPAQVMLEAQFNDSTGFSTVQRLFWVPFFKLHYVLRKCFEESGFNVSGSIFSDANFMRVVLYNTYSINRFEDVSSVTVGGTTTFTVKNASNFIDPWNHMPDMSKMDFILECQRCFNLNYRVDVREMRVSIDVQDLSTTVMPLLDLSSQAATEPDIIIEEQDFNNGYVFGYEFDSADRANGEGVDPEIKIPALFSVVSNAVNRGLLTGMALQDWIYQRGEASYRQFNGFVGPSAEGWVIKTLNGINYSTVVTPGANTVTIMSKIVPMNNQERAIDVGPAVANTLPIQAAKIMEGPVSNIGMAGSKMLFVNNPSRAANNNNLAGFIGLVSAEKPIAIQPHMLNWCGVQNLYTTTNAPVASSNNYTWEGAVMPGISSTLFWHTPDGTGLADIYWAAFQKLIERSPIMEYSVLLDAVTYSSNDLMQRTIQIRGLRYVVKKISLPLQFPSEATMELVRI